MKRTITPYFAILAFSFALVNCAGDMDPVDDNSDNPYHLFAEMTETRTVNYGMKTGWLIGDALNVFHAKAGTALFSDNIKFTLSEVETGEFHTDSFNGMLSEKNDWFVIYPYNEYVYTPSAESAEGFIVGSTADKPQNQTGNDDMAHIAGDSYPMWGVAEGVNKASVPSVGMRHLSSLVKVEVSNASESDLTVNSVYLTAPEDIVGRYDIDITSEVPVFHAVDGKSVSNTAVLNVADGNPIPAGGTGTFYFAVKPFAVRAGQELVLAVNGYEKVLEITGNHAFSPGKVKTLKFSYDKSDTPSGPADPACPTIEWIPEKFKPSAGMISGSYAYYIDVPDGYTAYIMSGSNTSFNGGDLELTVSAEEKIARIIEQVDRPKDVTKIVDMDLYRQLGPPNGCEYYHYEHGNPLAGNVVIWASEDFHDSVCDCKEHLSDEGIRNGVVVPINQVRYINDGTRLEIYQPDAVGIYGDFMDVIYIICMDLDGIIYGPFEIVVPAEYFR